MNIVRLLANRYDFKYDEAIQLLANVRRIESCKVVGGSKKRSGHERERLFCSMFGESTDRITYKAEADATISYTSLHGIALTQRLKTHFEIMPRFDDKVSIKGGNNIQFTLGRIAEVLLAENSLHTFTLRSFWSKYLGKDSSKNPAGWFVYREDAGWLFFRMADVIDFITDNTSWRLTKTGRIKGDIMGRQYITYEYRKTHKSYFLGANGNRGKPFIELIRAFIQHLQVEDI